MPRTPRSNRVLLTALLLGLSAPLSATPKDDFENEKTLEDATAEIFASNREQLDAIIDYVASCSPTPSPERNYQCSRAAKLIEIKCWDMTALNSLVFAMSLVDGAIKWEKAGATSSEISTIQRRVKVFRSLTMASGMRYSRGATPDANPKPK